jgi:predicted nuclease with TOPRIM domain
MNYKKKTMDKDEFPSTTELLTKFAGMLVTETISSEDTWKAKFKTISEMNDLLVKINNEQAAELVKKQTVISDLCFRQSRLSERIEKNSETLDKLSAVIDQLTDKIATLTSFNFLKINKL